MSTAATDLLQAMMEWMFSDTGIAARMEEFAHSYCAYFDYIEERGDFDAAENKLVYTQIYHKFQELFEGQLTEFLSNYGWSTEKFLSVCEEELSKREEGSENWASVYEVLVSLSDYNIFKIMMLDTRRKFPDLQQVVA